MCCLLSPFDILIVAPCPEMDDLHMQYDFEIPPFSSWLIINLDNLGDDLFDDGKLVHLAIPILLNNLNIYPCELCDIRDFLECVLKRGLQLILDTH
jgi:hypothetical protein